MNVVFSSALSFNKNEIMVHFGLLNQGRPEATLIISVPTIHSHAKDEPWNAPPHSKSSPSKMITFYVEDPYKL